MINKNIFRYKILESNRTSRKIMQEINEELNKGFTFLITPEYEKTISIAGKRKWWIYTDIYRDNLFIYVDDTFFNKSCIIEQILTSLWANLLDFGKIHLEGFKLSDNIHSLILKNSTCHTPEILKTKGPYFGTVFKPSFGLSISEKLKIAEKFAAIGGSFIKEDETYLIEKSKILKESKIIQKIINNVSRNCFYIPNITPHILDDDFLNRLYDTGIRIVMVNYLITALPTIYKVIKKHNKFLFWGHRVGYKSMEEFISMKAVALLATYTGINMLHIGTPFFSIQSNVKQSTETLKVIKTINPEIIPVFTKASPEIIHYLVKSFSKDIIIMVCGSIRTNGNLDWEKIKNIMKLINDEKR